MVSAIIGTWEGSMAGVAPGAALLLAGSSAGDAVEAAVCAVEDDPASDTIGYGGLPNRDGFVELDAAFMDGATLGFGAVMGVRHVKNPVKVARALSLERLDCQLVSEGAERYAVERGFELRNPLTEAARRKWAAERDAQKAPVGGLESRGHDTVGVVALDGEGRMAVGMSTSGLFLKRPGRVGDSPIIGAGFYCDGAVGGAAATGVGEYILRGCLCFEVVRLMGAGLSAQAACERALDGLAARLKGLGYPDEGMSVVALSRTGALGAASTWPAFPFTAAAGGEPARHFRAVRTATGTAIEPV